MFRGMNPRVDLVCEMVPEQHGRKDYRAFKASPEGTPRCLTLRWGKACKPHKGTLTRLDMSTPSTVTGLMKVLQGQRSHTALKTDPHCGGQRPSSGTLLGQAGG